MYRCNRLKQDHELLYINLARSRASHLHDVEGCDVGTAQLNLLLQELGFFTLQQTLVADDRQQGVLRHLKSPAQSTLL